ncbi:MAG: MFS transporter [Pseudomonadota bacterium]
MTGAQRTYAIQVSAMYGALFAVYGVQLPFMGVWLESAGFTAASIGLVMALPAVLRLVANPMIAMAADAGGAHARYVVALSVIGSLSAVALLASAHWFWIAISVAVLLVSLQSAMPLVEVIAMRGVRSLSLDYGRMRLWGSLTFIGGTMLGGAALEQAGVSVFPWLLLVTAIATATAAVFLPRATNRSVASREREPRSAPVSKLIDRESLRALVADRTLVLFLVGASAIQASHAVYYAFSAVHWMKLGIGSDVVGILWSLGVVAEILLFAVSGRAVRMFGATGLLAVGAIAGIVRWGVMAFDPTGLGLVALQILHAATFGATHLAAMSIISERVPEARSGLAQALFATFTSGVAMAGGLYAAGVLYGWVGATSYWAMSGLAAIGLLAAALSRWRDRR